MKILFVNGSPRPDGNTAALVEAFRQGGEERSPIVDIVPVTPFGLSEAGGYGHRDRV